MIKHDRHKYLYPAAIFGLALLLRLWNLLATGADFYANILSDASTYRFWASQIVAHIPYGEPVFMMGPLYPYWMALNLGLGINLYGFLVVQIILSSITCVLVYYIAKSLFDNKAALISGITAAIAAPFIFYSGLFLSETIQLLLLAISLWLIIADSPRFPRLKILLAGILIGLATLDQGTLLLYAFLLAGYWLIRHWRQRKSSAKKYLHNATLIMFGAIIGILPATIHNLAAGDFVLISSNMGINFYVGNNASASGTYDSPPGLNLTSDFTGRKVAERQMHRQLKSSEVSSYWSGRALDNIKANPLIFIGKLLNKTWLYLWYFDIPQAESIQTQHLFSPLFKIPLPGFGLILILGLIAFIISHKTENTWTVILLLAANIVSVTLFFAIGRFKLVGLLGLTTLSGQGVLIIWQAIKIKNYKTVMSISAIAIAVALILFLPRNLSRQEKLASAYNNIGIFHYYKGDLDKAIDWYRQSSAILPTFSGALNNIGTYFYLKGQIDSAMAYFNQSWNADTTESETAMNLGKLAEDRADYQQAISFYEKAKIAAPFGLEPQAAIDRVRAFQSTGGNIALSDQSFEALYDLAEKFAARRQFAEAQSYYERALKIRPDDIRALNNLGFAYQAMAKYPQAARCFEKALAQSPNNAIAYNNLAGTLYQMGMADSAKILWEKALKIDPDNSQIKKNLDFVKNRGGNR
jgi:tetratricopeptide (TPR) repeat protein